MSAGAMMTVVDWLRVRTQPLQNKYFTDNPFGFGWMAELAQLADLAQLAQFAQMIQLAQLAKLAELAELFLWACIGSHRFL